MRGTSLFLVALCAAPAAALPPTEVSRGFVDGANHHLGDTSFVERYGHAPQDAHDDEALRMHTHLRYVRAWLGARPATSPELAARRQVLLGYLDDYIAKGITPLNTHVAWRSPVFVDVFGNVCAVGYLIERSVGRALVERIAAQHRTDYLEDITLPEVAAWVASSGFTLEELASIQPGYMRPVIEEWRTWDLTKARPVDGPWSIEAGGVTTRGAWRAGAMTGPWQRLDSEGHVIGLGEFTRGRGLWTSRDAIGRKLAEGPFVHSQPDGTWRFFHPSGHLAAEGPMRRGYRHGQWTFFYDATDTAGAPIPLSRGRFASGSISGTWRHFDARGAPFARTWTGPEMHWGAVLRTRLERRDGLLHEIASGNFGGDGARTDALELDGVRIYASRGYEDVTWLDVDGFTLTRDADGWRREGCAWDAATRRAARSGKLERVMDHLLSQPAATAQCNPAAVDPTTQRVLDRIIALTTQVRTPTPQFALPLIETEEPQPASVDLRDTLVDNMRWYIEWPHVDVAFARVFTTLPGHYSPEQLFDFAVEEDDYTVVSTAAGARLFFR